MDTNHIYTEKIQYIEKKVIKHDSVAEKSISLVASGNIVSPFVHELMNTDLLYRAAEDKKGKSNYPGLEYFYDIEEISEHEIASIFHADFADLRPISGTIANIIVYTACSNIGDTILVNSIKSGSHISQAGAFLTKLRDYNFIRLSTLNNSYVIDVDKCCFLIKKHKPSLLLLGGSVCIEWQDISPIVEIAHKNNCIVIYDASHVAGLIATKYFPNPLDYDVDIMTMTTCKTIPGPSHSWILGKKEFKNKIGNLVFPGFISGGHLQEYIGAIVSLYEVLKYDREYGKRIINCSNILGCQLEEYGFKFLKTQKEDYSETHQIISYYHNDYSAKDIERKLTDINILINMTYLPENCSYGEYGLRWGTQEFVRIGGNAETMNDLILIIKGFLSEKTPNLSYYKEKVLNLRMQLLRKPLF